MAKILIVEDENIVAWDLKETLEKLGHSVVDLVVSGIEAVGAAAKTRPDLVLMDIRLVGAMDGIAAGGEIYHQFNIPIVYLTAHADELTLARATKTDPFGYIIKPFQSRSLQSTIKIALQRHQSEASAHLERAYLANTLNSIGSGTIATDRQGLVTFINPIAAALTGWDAQSAIGIEIDRVFRLIWETDGTRIENPSSRAMRLQQPVKSPDRCWLLTKDGLEIPISDTATPIFQPDGEIVGSVVVFEDNSEHLSTQMDLWEHSQDIEFFQLKLISQLQAKTAEYQQAIACLGIWDLLCDLVLTATSESELLQSALAQIGRAIAVDYCWVTLHDPQGNTATIVCEYIDRDRPTYPASKIGREIEIKLYTRFYHHLLVGASWIAPPDSIAPQPYLDLFQPTAQISIFPLAIDYGDPEDRAAQEHDDPDRLLYQEIVGEVGIVTTGKPAWTIGQTSPIAQILGSAIKLFRQQSSPPFDPTLEWLDRIKDDFASSADVDRDLHLSAHMLDRQFATNPEHTENLPAVGPLELSVNLEILEAQWQRQVQLIDTLIDVRVKGTSFQVQALSDVLFYKWIAAVVKSCGDLAQRYRLDFSDRITDSIPEILLCAFPILELAILELFHNACKYTPPDYPILLEVNISDNLLELSVVSLEIALSAPELETMFSRLTSNLPIIDIVDLVGEASPSENPHPPQPAGTALGLALVQKLVGYLGGNIQARSDRDSTRLILSMPLL
jgi:PAS domain S-box-containing protein